jgi:modulator of FtsH protease
MYQSPGQYPSYQQGNQAIVSQASTAGLLGQVLGITGAGFLITAAASYLFQGAPQVVAMPAMLVGLALLMAINLTRANGALSLALFYLFAACEGVGIAPVIGAYVRGLGSGVVVEAAATTGLGMVTLGSIAWLSSFDFRRLQNLAFGLVIGLVVVGFIGVFVHFLHPQVYSWATLGVFTLLTLVDFARIRAGGDGLSPVLIAVSIYLDGINIFMALLQILGMRGRRDD